MGLKNEFMWILSREPTLDSEVKDHIMEVIKRELPGYDLDNLELTPQTSCSYDA